MDGVEHEVVDGQVLSTLQPYNDLNMFSLRSPNVSLATLHSHYFFSIKVEFSFVSKNLLPKASNIVKKTC